MKRGCFVWIALALMAVPRSEGRVNRFDDFRLPIPDKISLVPVGSAGATTPSAPVQRFAGGSDGTTSGLQTPKAGVMTRAGAVEPALETIAAPSTPAPASATGEPPGAPATVSVERRLNEAPEQRRMGATFTYIVTVRWQGDLDVSAPASPELSGLEWINSQTRDRIEGGRVSRECVFTLRPVAEGPASIGVTRLYYTDRATKQQSSIEAPGMQIDVLPAPRDYRPLARNAGLALLGIVLAAGTALVVLRLVRRAPEPPAEAPRSPLDDLAAASDGLGVLLVQGEAREFFSRLARLIRELLEATGQPEAARQTTGQIRERLAAVEPARADAARILELLEACDAVRFAGHVPSREECESVLRDWKALIHEARTPQPQQTQPTQA